MAQVMHAPAVRVAQAREVVKPLELVQMGAAVAVAVVQTAGLLVAHSRVAPVHQTGHKTRGLVAVVPVPAATAATQALRPFLAVRVVAQQVQAIQQMDAAVEALRALIRQRQPQARQTLQVMRYAFPVIF